MSTIRTPEFWRLVLARAGRNAVQVVIPLLMLAVAGHVTSAGILATAAAAVLAGLASVLKSLAGVTSDAGDSLAWQVAERAIGAAAGTAAALIPLDLTGAIALDWRAGLTAVAGAIGLSLVAWVTNAPTAAPLTTDAAPAVEDVTGGVA